MAQIQDDLEEILYALMGRLAFSYGDPECDLEEMVHEMFRIMAQLPEDNDVRGHVPFSVFHIIRLRSSPRFPENH